MADYKLLQQLERTFRDGPYLHRRSNLGNRIADCLYEDLYELGASAKLRERIDQQLRVLNPKGVSPGIHARRGDGSFGPPVPGWAPTRVPGFVVARGLTAEVEIGAEVKILAKAMMKQIDRVMSDLRSQANHFRRKSPTAITVGIVAITSPIAIPRLSARGAFPRTARHTPTLPKRRRRLRTAFGRCKMCLMSSSRSAFGLPMNRRTPLSSWLRPRSRRTTAPSSFASRMSTSAGSKERAERVGTPGRATRRLIRSKEASPCQGSGNSRRMRPTGVSPLDTPVRVSGPGGGGRTHRHRAGDGVRFPPRNHRRGSAHDPTADEME